MGELTQPPDLMSAVKVQIAEKHVPALVQNFDAIRQQSNPESQCLLNEIPCLFPDTATLEQYFTEGKEAWEFVYDEQKVRAALADASSQEAREYLKKVRHFGLTLKAGYQLFDANHSAPASLHQFVKILGEHNDRLGSPRQQEYATKLLLSGTMEELRDEPFTFHPCSLESFNSYVQITVGQINTFMGMETLHTPDFHQLRKKVRIIMNLLQFPAGHSVAQTPNDIFIIFYTASKQLGAMHDWVVNNSFDTPEVYERTALRVPSQIRESVQQGEEYLLQALRIAPNHQQE